MEPDELFGLSLLLLSLVCLGTWPAILRKCSDSSNHLCFTYVNYSIAYCGVSFLPLLFSNDAMHVEFPLLLAAGIGGALLSLGNLSLQWAVSPVFGLPLTTTLAIQASLTVLLGTSVNYLIEPEKTPRPGLLIIGVGVFFLAISFATCTQLEYGKQQNKEYAELELADYGATDGRDEEAHEEIDAALSVKPIVKSKFSGLIVAVLGGLAFGFFSPAFNVAVNDPYGWSDEPQSIVYTNIWFSLAFVITSAVSNVCYLLQQYQSMETIWGHYRSEKMACLAGVVCGLGNILQFHGGQYVGYATADLVQAYPIVSTVWDVTVFGEFRSINCHLGTLLCSMYVAYLAGIGLLAASSLHR